MERSHESRRHHPSLSLRLGRLLGLPKDLAQHGAAALLGILLLAGTLTMLALEGGSCLPQQSKSRQVR